MNAKILVVDDDPDILSGLQGRLRLLGYDTVAAADGMQALALIEQELPNLILLDLEMPELSGMEVLRRLAKKRPGDVSGSAVSAPPYAGIAPPVIVMTAYGSIERAVEAMKLGAYDFLTKPFDADHLSILIQKTLERETLLRRVERLREEVDAPYGTIVGDSPQMKSAVDLARRAAESQVTVLLLGETGTGKELLARAIHRWSPRQAGQFMVINCAALPEHLLENEFFGHERGAFTGADRLHEGKIEAADGGTVFLDEIGDMPLALQGRLLRVLQDQEFHRVGGTRSIRVNVRFIAATNRDIHQAVRAGAFREDLFFRLNVLTINLPPLRERSLDLPHLARLFLERHARETNRGSIRLSDEALHAMLRHPWPGNIRELDNVMARAMVINPGGEIGPEHLGLPVGAHLPDSGQVPRGAACSYREALERHGRWLILEALRRTGWNQTKAAEELKVQRSYLVKLMKRKSISTKPLQD